MSAPSTVLQLALLVLVVLPGITYQFLRERLRGPVPGEQNLGERVARALVASLVLDALYLVLIGPTLVRVVRGGQKHGWSHVFREPRLTGLLGLVLFVLVPAFAAFLVTRRERRRLNAARYQATPTAWDQMFRKQGSCFVRVRMKDGSWAGGWYGKDSYATSYPHPQELYLESAWMMDGEGAFLRRVDGSGGLFVRSADTDYLEIVRPDDTKRGDDA
ncbi:DUF6338 family protein [Actinomadura oligospora]|uniref:DUF6338 family protein n=1 Tax=Actinomadura oligospora TaxID=111804 RepID=UPI00054EDF6F|nr:DUF6338 family protein [Actinomadura oligospora]